MAMKEKTMTKQEKLKYGIETSVRNENKDNNKNNNNTSITSKGHHKNTNPELVTTLCDPRRAGQGKGEGGQDTKPLLMNRMPLSPLCGLRLIKE